MRWGQRGLVFKRIKKVVTIMMIQSSYPRVCARWYTYLDPIGQVSVTDKAGLGRSTAQQFIQPCTEWLGLCNEYGRALGHIFRINCDD